MAAIRFIRCQRKDLPRVKELGGKPADVYYTEDGYLYIIDREGIPVTEVDEIKIDSKTEEGLENFESKSEWWKDFPTLEGVFEEYGDS